MSMYSFEPRKVPELSIFLFFLMLGLCLIPKDQLYLDKACKVNLKGWLAENGLNTTACDNKNNDIKKNDTNGVDVEAAAQKIVAELRVYEGILCNIPSVIYSMFAGPWSDENGRRLLMIIPIIGQLLATIVLIIGHYVDSLPAEFLLLWASTGAFGYMATLDCGAFGYISDVSTKETKTLRMSIGTGCITVGIAIGTLFSGLVSSVEVIYFTSIGVGTLALLYTMFILKDSIDREATKKYGKFFDMKNVIDCFRVVFKPGPNRKNMMVAIFTWLCLMICMNTSDYDYMMAKNKFSWGREEYSLYMSVNQLVKILSLFLLLPFLIRVLRFSDQWITILGCFLTTIAYILIMLSDSSWPASSSGWPMWVFCGIQLFSLVTASTRAIVSKLVVPEEVGKSFAFLGVFMAFMPLVMIPVIGFIYSATVTIYKEMDESFFRGIIGGAYLIPVIVLMTSALIVNIISVSKRVDVKHAV